MQRATCKIFAPLRRKIMWPFLFLFFSQSLFSAAPVTHAYLAIQWIKQHPRHTQSTMASFMRGTLFPDIRHMLNIPREKTHQTGITLREINSAATHFQAGWFFHSFVDEERDTFIKKKSIYRTLQSHFLLPKRELSLFLKLVEDEILFSKLEREIASSAMLGLDKEEKSSNIPKETLHRWHSFMLLCLNQRPSDMMKELSDEKKGFLSQSPETVKRWSKLLEQAKHDEALQAYVAELVAHFQNRIKQEK